MNPDAKPFYLSKTFWLNLVALASMAVPQVKDFLEGNPETAVSVLVAVNVLLRFATKGAIYLREGDDSSGGGAGGAWLVAAALLCAGLLPSCSDYSISGAAYYRDPGTGAKGGLKIVDGVRTWFGRVPVYDEETGEQIGSAEVEVTSGK